MTHSHVCHTLLLSVHIGVNSIGSKLGIGSHISRWALQSQTSHLIGFSVGSLGLVFAREIFQVGKSRLACCLSLICKLLADWWFTNSLSWGLSLTQKALTSFIFRRRSNLERIILVVYKQSVIADFDRSETFLITLVGIDLFESIKCHLLVTQDVIIVDLISWLFRVELVLKHADLFVECLQLVEEGTTRWFECLSGIWFSTSRSLFWTYTCNSNALYGLLMLHLSLMLGLYLGFPGFFIEIASHEILKGVDIFV